MANALTALQRVQAGIEATFGTTIAATRRVPHLPGTGYTEMQNRKKLEEPRGVLGYVDDVLTRQMTALELEQELDFEHSLLPLLCGIEGVDAVGLAAPYSYAMDIPLTAARTLDSATIQVVQSDGASNHVSRQMSGARPTAISIEFELGGTAMIKSTWAGQAGAALAIPTTVAVAARKIIPAELFTIEVDDTWAGLGTTDATNVRSLGLEINTGLTQSHHYRGRAGLDADGWYQGRVDGKVSVVYDLDAAAAAELVHRANGDLRFIRLKAEDGSGTGLREMQIDIAGRYIADPNQLGSDGEQSIIEFEAEFRADGVGGSAPNMFAMVVQNALASF